MQRDECTLNATLAALYHSVYMLVCSYIMIQLVIGIILDNIQAASIMEDMTVKQVGSPPCSKYPCQCLDLHLHLHITSVPLNIRMGRLLRA